MEAMILKKMKAGMHCGRIFQTTFPTSSTTRIILCTSATSCGIFQEDKMTCRDYWYEIPAMATGSQVFLLSMIHCMANRALCPAACERTRPAIHWLHCH